jgi:hypothetical protein
MKVLPISLPHWRILVLLISFPFLVYELNTAKEGILVADGAWQCSLDMPLLLTPAPTNLATICTLHSCISKRRTTEWKLREQNCYILQKSDGFSHSTVKSSYYVHKNEIVLLSKTESRGEEHVSQNNLDQIHVMGRRDLLRGWLL